MHANTWRLVFLFLYLQPQRIAHRNPTIRLPNPPRPEQRLASIVREARLAQREAKLEEIRKLSDFIHQHKGHGEIILSCYCCANYEPRDPEFVPPEELLLIRLYREYDELCYTEVTHFRCNCCLKLTQIPDWTNLKNLNKYLNQNKLFCFIL